MLLAGRRVATGRGMRRALEGAGFTVCGVAADAPAAVVAALREQPDVCLLEGRPGPATVQATHEISARLPRTSVIVLGDPAQREDVFLALGAGAAGFLPSDMKADRLAATLRGVADGEAALPRALVADLISEFRRLGQRDWVDAALVARGAKLTPRERQILELLAEGRTSAEIAERLHIALPTVRTHAAAMARKLGASGRAEAVSVYNEAFRNLNAE